MDNFNEELGLKVPEHIAIILDGNGRWAKKHLVPKNVGHAQGAKTVEKVCRDAYELGVKYLTVYAFSTENWKRSEEEVAALMKILRSYLADCLKKSKDNNMRIKCIGDKTGLSADIIEKINELEEESKNNTGLTFIIGLNYGGRDEITRMIKKLIDDVEAGKVLKSDITEKLISERLDTSGIPDPDLLIRTSGEQRLSNFLPWQLTYAEFCFLDVLWPDFKKEDLIEAIKAYNKRDRRFGKRNDE